MPRKLEKHEIKFIQGLLYNYPMMKKELAELDQQISSIQGEISSPSLDRIPAKGTIGDPTAGKAFRVMRIKAAWEHKAFYARAIEDVLELLDPPRRAVIEMKYFKNWTRCKVAQENYISEQTVFRWERELWPVFADRLGM